MTLIVDETFEGAGYEESWSELVGAGNTVDEDADSADAGSPSGWGLQCLYIDCANIANNCLTERAYSGLPISYTRIEFVLDAESFANGEGSSIAAALDDSFDDAWVLRVVQISGSLFFRLDSFHNGSLNTYIGFTAITTGIRHRIEIKWDATNNLWAWRHNGVNQPNDQDASDPVTSEGLLTSTHVVTNDLLSIGTGFGDPEAIWDGYFDRIAIDDADWVGSAGGGGIAVLRRRIQGR